MRHNNKKVCKAQQHSSDNVSTLQWSPSKPDPLRIRRNVRFRLGFRFKAAIYLGTSTFGTKGHVW